MSKDLYDIVADKVIEFCRKTYYDDCLVKFEISYDMKEWDTVTCVVECDVRENIVFQWDFCEGQKYIRNFRICHTSEAEPVIHCKDCKYYGDADYEEPEYHECRFFSNWATVHYILESDFCSCAEKGKAPL